MTDFSHHLSRREFQNLSLGVLLMSMARISSAAEGEPANVAQSLPTANNRFAWRFLKSIESLKPASNHFVSPFSIECALLMTLEGARNRTAREMGETLGLPAHLARPESNAQWDLVAIRESMNALLERFRALSESLDAVVLRLANGIWADKKSTFVPEFIEVVQKRYRAQIKNVDFQSGYEAQRKLINKWVSEQTENRINDLIPIGAVGAMTRMVLANAVYFRGTWAEPFKESATNVSDFYSRGTTKVSTPMMNSFRAKVRYGAFQSDGSRHVTPTKMQWNEIPKDAYPKEGFQIVEMPYNGGELSMIILLPSQRDGLPAIMNTISSEQFDRCVEQLEARRVQVSIPKFKLESQYDLREALETMGMVSPFDSHRAEFSGMSLEPLLISKVLHKSFVEVNEKGTEAAAATAVIIAPTSAAPSQDLPFDPKFIADHPFLFVIRHNPSGIQLFIGKMETP